jgi:hypothetical protein
MQTNFIIQLFTPYIQKETAQLAKQLGETLDFRQFEDGMQQLMDQLAACIITCALEDWLTTPAFLMQLKSVGGKLGMRFKEYRTLRIRLGSGLHITLATPYFIKTKPKRGPKKKDEMGGESTLVWKSWVFWGRPALLF